MSGRASITSEKHGDRNECGVVSALRLMNRARFGQLFRFAVASLLLLVIFHVIFCNEAQLQLSQQPGAWESMTRWGQRRYAWQVGPVGLWRTAWQLDSLSLLGAFGLCGVPIFLGALRWRQALRVQGLDVSPLETCRISLVAHFFNAFLLGSTGGDVVKAWHAAKLTHHKRAEAATTVFVDRLLGTAALLLFAVAMIPFCWRAGRPAPGVLLFLEYHRYSGVALLILGMLAVAVLALGIGFYSDALAVDSTLSRLTARLPWGAAISRALAACRAFGHARFFMPIVAGYSLLINAAIVGTFLCLAYGLHLNEKVPTAVFWFVVPAVVCVSALPITPSGLGVREHLFVLLLTVPAFPEVKHAEALSLSLLGYSVNLAWSAVGGLVYLFFPVRLPEAGEPVDG